MSKLLNRLLRPDQAPRRKLAPKTIRQVKVTYEARERPGFTYNGFVPFIRLRGRWLEEAGFRIGDDVLVHVEHGKLTITRK